MYIDLLLYFQKPAFLCRLTAWNVEKVVSVHCSIRNAELLKSEKMIIKVHSCFSGRVDC